MDEAFKKQAEEWFERGLHDIETAQLLYDERGYTDSIAYHIQQAIEKYLRKCVKRPHCHSERPRLVGGVEESAFFRPNRTKPDCP